jgi:peptide chain release factor 2
VPGSLSSGTLFDIPGKTTARDKLEARQAEPDFWTNQEQARSVIQQLKVANALLKPYEELIRATGELNAMAELAEEDASFEAEMEPVLAKAETQYEGFELQAMMSGKQDAANAIVTIKPGAGGTEACDWAQILYRMYTRWAQKHGFEVEELDLEPNLEAGILKVEFKIIGPYAYGYMQSEIGVHRLVRISPFGNGTRETSFAGVDVLPELDDTIEIEIKEDDIIKQTFSAGGPGGQHQNKTQSGVRLIHQPTGVRAESRTERSQHKNYDNCIKMLKARLYAIEEQKRMGDIAQRYDAKGEIAFGSQIRSYVLQPYTLVRDERDGIDVKTPGVMPVLDGDLDQFMYAYLRYKTAKQNKKK